MPYSEKIGRVVGADGIDGKDGKTYRPVFIQQAEDNTLYIQFIDDNPDGESVVKQEQITLPFIEPVIENNTLTFRYNNGIQSSTYNNFTYDLENLRGRPGSLKVNNVNIDNISQNITVKRDGSFTTAGKAFDDDDKFNALQFLFSDNDTLNGDTYFAEYNSATQNTIWTRVTDFIDIDNYVKKDTFNAFKNDLNNKIACITQQQSDIQKILREGIDTEIESPYDTMPELVFNLNTIKLTWSDAETIEGPVTAYDFIQNISTLINPQEQQND